MAGVSQMRKAKRRRLLRHLFCGILPVTEGRMGVEITSDSSHLCLSASFSVFPACPDREIVTVYALPLHFFVETTQKYFSFRGGLNSDENLIQKPGDNLESHRIYDIIKNVGTICPASVSGRRTLFPVLDRCFTSKSWKQPADR